MLASTPFSTLVLELSHSGMNELDQDLYPGFIRNARTLAACSMDSGGTCVQITNSGIHMIDMLSNGMAGQRWPPSDGVPVEITAADANPTQVCVALKGGRLLYFDARGGSLKLLT